LLEDGILLVLEPESEILMLPRDLLRRLQKANTGLALLQPSGINKTTDIPGRNYRDRYASLLFSSPHRPECCESSVSGDVKKKGQTD
jgi:hypothetical protein